MRFNEFPFIQELIEGIEAVGFEECTPVQEQSFTHYFNNLDIYAQSQTGTGKTAAFLLCGIQELAKRNAQRHGKDLEPGQKTEFPFAGDIKMLVLSPTRELAEQITKETGQLTAKLPLKSASFYGGVGYEEQCSHLEDGVQIIIGTPGRIIDLAKSGKFRLDQISVIVLDEADRMLDFGFIDDIRWVMNQLPDKSDRLTMFFSATLSSKVGNLTWEFMREVGEVLIETEKVTTEAIEQELYHVSNKEKLRLLLSLIKKLEPESAIIFSNTKSGAEFLERCLQNAGYRAKALIGDLPQHKRNQVLQQLKDKKIDILVATDVASRGLHIEDLPLVINYDLPDEAENYVHRIGRTARAGKEGKAVSLACERYVYNLSEIEKFIGQKIPVCWFEETHLISAPLSPASQRSRRSNSSQNEPKRPPERRNRSKSSSSKNRDSKPAARSQSRPAKETQEKKVPGKPPQGSAKDRLLYYEKKYNESFGASKKGKSAGGQSKRPQNRDLPKGKETRSQNQPKTKVPSKRSDAAPKPSSLWSRVLSSFRQKSPK